MSIGSLAWTQRRGVLTLLERWRLTLTASGQCARHRDSAQAAALPMPPRPSTGLGPAALDDIERPWNALAYAASGAAQALQPPWLTNHGLRSYAWASLLAVDSGLDYDRSLLFAACLLHGVGLSVHAAEPADQCFTMRSAGVAHSVLKRAGASESQLHCVAEAITLHANPEVGRELGAEAHLLQAGTALDIIGTRSPQIPARLRLAVLQRHPRLGFKAMFRECMAKEALRAPNSRIGLYVRRLGLLELIARAPFDE